MIRKLIIDASGLAGFAALIAGVYLRFGLSVAMMIGGGMALVAAILATKRGGAVLFDSLFRSDPGEGSIENPATPITWSSAEGPPESFSETVSPANAWKLSAVYSCINVLSSSIAQLPLVVLRKMNDTVTPATDHPAYWLLHNEPNYWQTSYKWRETKQAHVCGYGNGYACS